MDFVLDFSPTQKKGYDGLLTVTYELSKKKLRSWSQHLLRLAMSRRFSSNV